MLAAAWLRAVSVVHSFLLTSVPNGLGVRIAPTVKGIDERIGVEFLPPSFFACSKNSIIAFARRTKLLCISQCKMIASKYLSTLQMLNLLRRPKEMKYLKVTLLERGLFFFLMSNQDNGINSS